MNMDPIVEHAYRTLAKTRRNVQRMCEEAKHRQLNVSKRALEIELSKNPILTKLNDQIAEFERYRKAQDKPGTHDWNKGYWEGALFALHTLRSRIEREVE